MTGGRFREYPVVVLRVERRNYRDFVSRRVARTREGGNYRDLFPRLVLSTIERESYRESLPRRVLSTTEGGMLTHSRTSALACVVTRMLVLTVLRSRSPNQGRAVFIGRSWFSSEVPPSQITTFATRCSNCKL
eukprot:7825338-Pyramimonas_sp.AAC.1